MNSDNLYILNSLYLCFVIADMMAMMKVYGYIVFGTLDLDGHMNAHILIGQMFSYTVNFFIVLFLDTPFKQIYNSSLSHLKVLTLIPDSFITGKLAYRGILYKF